MHTNFIGHEITFALMYFLALDVLDVFWMLLLSLLFLALARIYLCNSGVLSNCVNLESLVDSRCLYTHVDIHLSIYM